MDGMLSLWCHSCFPVLSCLTKLDQVAHFYLYRRLYWRGPCRCDNIRRSPRGSDPASGLAHSVCGEIVGSYKFTAEVEISRPEENMCKFIVGFGGAK